VFLLREFVELASSASNLRQPFFFVTSKYSIYRPCRRRFRQSRPRRNGTESPSTCRYRAASASRLTESTWNTTTINSG
jgi:hypothetical protein